MKEELEKTLMERFPTFFIDMYGDEMKTCMHFGCEFSDGWYDLLFKTCEKIESHLLGKPLQYPFKFEQIKEKWGQMRIYHNGDQEIDKIIDAAEKESATICENCGKPGKLNNRGWI